MVKGDRKLCPSHPITSLDFDTNLMCLFLLHHAYDLVAREKHACFSTPSHFWGFPPQQYCYNPCPWPPQSYSCCSTPPWSWLCAPPLPHAAPLLSLTATSHHFSCSFSGLGYLTGLVELPPRFMAPLCLTHNPLKYFAIHQCACCGTVVENCCHRRFNCKVRVKHSCPSTMPRVQQMKCLLINYAVTGLRGMMKVLHIGITHNWQEL